MFCLLTESLSENLCHAITDISTVTCDDDGILRQKIEYGYLLLILPRHGGNDAKVRNRMVRQLSLYVEDADTLDLVTKEVDAERLLVRVTEHVHDAATHGVLTRLIDIVNALESKCIQLVFEVAEIECHTHSNRQRVFRHLLSADDTFCKRFGIGDDSNNAVVRRMAQLREHLCTQHLISPVALVVFDGAAIGRGKEEHPLSPHELHEVVVEIACLFAIVEDEEQ